VVATAARRTLLGGGGGGGGVDGDATSAAPGCGRCDGRVRMGNCLTDCHNMPIRAVFLHFP